MSKRGTNVEVPKTATFVLLGGLALWRFFTAGPPSGDDWGHYLSHAAALLDGRSYGDIGYLYSDYAWTTGPPAYPPGLPLTLAPVIAVFGTSTLVPRLLMHAILALWLVAVYRTFKRDSATLALGTVAMLGTFLLLGDFPNSVGSDLGMCAFIWFAIWQADSNVEWSRRRAVGIGVFGLLAISYRVAAAPLVGAIFLWGLVHRRTAGARPWVVGAVWAIALIAVLRGFNSATDVARSVVTLASAEDGSSPLAAGLRWTLERIDSKVMSYRYALFDAHLYPFPGRLANQLYHVAGFALMVGGLWGWLQRRWRSFGFAFAVMTGGMLLVAPVWDARYAWVLAPFFCFGLARGLALLLQKFNVQNPRAATIAAGLILGLAGAASARAWVSPRVAASPPEAWVEVTSALHAPSDVEVRAASNRPRSLTWLTEIPAAGFPHGEIDVFLSEVDRLRVTHVVISRNVSDQAALERFDAWRQEEPDLFALVAQRDGVEGYRIERAAN